MFVGKPRQYDTSGAFSFFNVLKNQMLTGSHEALYRGQAGIGDYVCGDCRKQLIPGKIYELTFGSNMLGSFVINGIKLKDEFIIDKTPELNDSTAFRYHFEEGFSADWLIL